MTMLQSVTVMRGIPANGYVEAATIYFAAFQRKLGPILGGPERAIPLIAQSLDSTCALVAVDGDRVLGLAGLHHEGRHLVRWGLKQFMAAYGLSGLWRWAAASLMMRAPRQGVLVMDGIAVAPAARGSGIGSRLLEAVAAFAREHGYSAVQLAVVDSNPGARRLYERVGFVPVATASYPFLRAFGFTAVTTMELSLAEGERHAL
jgi:ribosomal protein S18 acetylase RimI-like enzyme